MIRNSEELLYSPYHIWLSFTDDYTAICGVTEFFNEKIGEIVFADLPEYDTDVRQGEKLGYLESATDTYDLLSPVSGRILEINPDVEHDFGILNSDPYGEGWIFKIDAKSGFEVDDLMDQDDYREHARLNE